MAIMLAGVFGGDLTQEAPKAAAISAIKYAALKAPIKALAKELSKLVPGLGQVVAPTVSFAIAEGGGWVLAKDMERRFCK